MFLAQLTVILGKEILTNILSGLDNRLEESLSSLENRLEGSLSGKDRSVSHCC